MSILIFHKNQIMFEQTATKIIRDYLFRNGYWLAQKFGQQAVSFNQLFTEHDLLANNTSLNDLVVYNLEVFLRKNLFDEISKQFNVSDEEKFDTSHITTAVIRLLAQEIYQQLNSVYQVNYQYFTSKAEAVDFEYNLKDAINTEFKNLSKTTISDN